MSCFVRWLVTHSSSSYATVGNAKEFYTERSTRLDSATDQSGAASRRGEQHHDQQTNRMALADAQRRQQPATETQQATKTGQESPFLNALVGTRVLAVAAVELYRHSTQLQEEQEVFAEAYHRQKVREAVARSRKKKWEQDPQAYEAYKEREKLRRRESRARDKQKAEAQQPQDPQENPR